MVKIHALISYAYLLGYDDLCDNNDGVMCFSCVASVTHFLIIGGLFMPNYEKLYHMMFNEVTDTIENLKQLQLKVEEEYLKSCEEEETGEIKKKNNSTVKRDVI